MREARASPANRRFGNDCPKNPKQPKKEEQKATPKKVVEEEARDKERRISAEQEIKGLMRYPGRSFIKLLPVVEMRVRNKEYPAIVLEILLERIRRNQWKDLSLSDQCLVVKMEASLVSLEERSN